MLTVTTNAKEKLKEVLLNVRPKEDDLSLLRIEKQSSNSAKVEIFLDTEREEDNVIIDNEGDKLLLIGQHITPFFNGMTLDFTETEKGQNFTFIEG